MLLILCLFNDGGHTYDSENKRVLQLVEKNTKELVIEQTVEEIKSETKASSAFYNCRTIINTVSFEKNSQCKILGDYLFSETSLRIIDFTNCQILNSISKYCFYNCKKLTTIKLPPNVITLSSGSFYSCTLLEEIVIPDSVETVAYCDSENIGVFRGCSKLKTVEISENSNLKTIGDLAFQESGITTFFIPKNVSSIGNLAFANCKIESFKSHEDNNYYLAEGKAIYDRNKNTIWFIAGADSNTNFTVPETVNTIKSYSFIYSTFYSIIFTNQYVIINTAAFQNSRIIEIIFPTGLTAVPESCFLVSTIEKIKLSNKITTINKNAFLKCTNLRTIVLFEGLNKICAGAFSGCTSIILTIPNSVTKIESGALSSVPIENVTFLNSTRFHIVDDILYCDSAFVDYFGQNPDKEIVIPASCTSFPDSMFIGKSLKSITFAKNSQLTTIGSYCFQSSTLVSIILPPSLQSLSEYAFFKSEKLTTVVFTDNILTTLPYETFFGCTSLTSLTFDQNNKVSKIDIYAFLGCTSLEFDLRQLKQLKTLKEGSFMSTKLPELYIPEHVTEFDDLVFSNSEIERVYIGISDSNDITQKTNTNEDVIKEVHSSIFRNCKILKELHFGPTIESISISAFEGCTSLQSFTLGTSIKNIGSSSFKDCTSLTTITIPDGAQLELIEGYAFYNTKLKSFITENTTEFIFDDGILMDGLMTKLIYYIPSPEVKSLVIPSTIQEICPYSFYGAKNLVEVIFSRGNLQRIGFQSFMDCVNLRRIVLPNSLKSIDDMAFENCNKIVCGGLTLNVSLKQQAKDAGIKELPLSDGCLNNFEALLRRKTCKINQRKKTGLIYFIIISGFSQ